MIKIGICDDDLVMVQSVRKIVDDYFLKKQISIEIFEYHAGIEVIQSDEEIDLIFLDIEMPELDGIRVAKYLNEKAKIRDVCTIKIVFLTCHVELVRKAFHVNAFRFLLKDNYDSEIKECLEAFCEETFMNEILWVKRNGVEISIKQRDILYITAAHNGSEVWVKDDMFNSKLSLNKLMELLNIKIFMRVHKKIIVNLIHINYIEDYIYMYTGEKVEYSRRNKKELHQRLYQYIYETAR